jgi:hypothetical protein
LHSIYGIENQVSMKSNFRPTRGRKHQDGEASPREVLLITQILVGSHQQGEFPFRSPEKITVAQMGPAQLEGGGHLVTAEDAP